MRFLYLSLCLIFSICQQVYAKSVFAHFMVGNTPNFTTSTWESDIKLAQAAHIDAFALNMAWDDPTNTAQVPNAFTAANNLGFKLFFSFDYAGNGPWEDTTVITMINQYKGNAAYFFRGSQPFVSTFEGPDYATNWTTIKAQTDCYFMPDWSSLGAEKALVPGVADGLFSWAAWPWGSEDSSTYVDASYIQFLNGKPYMMGVSPWFFTNLPGYDKNWMWRGDNLWFDRWQEVWYVQPDYVEIITWNDFGESHYIGPLNPLEYELFNIGDAPYNYAEGFPHDGWRSFLPYLIDMYKTGTASITLEGVVGWYRVQPASACDNGGTTGNTASQLQIEFEPQTIVQDAVFFSALLASPADVTVTIGEFVQKGTWRNTPSGGIGIYHGSVPFQGNLGAVTITIKRDGALVAEMDGEAISNTCTNGVENWNAWVGIGTADDTIPAASPTLPLSEQVCIRGNGTGNFNELCEFTCSLGYCPIGACLCTAVGPQPPLPSATNIVGYPIAGESASYSGLCSFACAHGYCPPSACGTVSVPLATPTVSPFLPPACIAGTGTGILEKICTFSCNYGFCPIHFCTCTAQGALIQAPPMTDIVGTPLGGDGKYSDAGLCAFSCSYGYCDSSVCSSYVDKGISPTAPGPILYNQSSCDNLEGVSSDIPGNDVGQFIARYFWDATDATTWFQDWIARYYPNDTCCNTESFLYTFLDKNTVGTLEAECNSVNAVSCYAFSCSEWGNIAGESGSGLVYEVIVSMTNFFRTMQEIWSAFNSAELDFAINQVTIQQAFYPVSDSSDSFALQELLNGLSTVIGILGAVAIAPELAGASAFLQGIISGVSLAIQPADDATAMQISDIESFVNSTFSNTQTGFEWVYGNFTKYGHYKDAHLVDLFAHGAWLDLTSIPILNNGAAPGNQSISATDLTSLWYDHLIAGIINAYWPKQRTFIMAYPMTQAQFQNTVVQAGNNDLRLKGFYNDVGYFFQSLTPYSSLGDEFPFEMQDPPGWGYVTNFSWTTQDIIKSSVASFAAGGFNYQADNNIDDMLMLNTTDISSLISYSFSRKGVFTLPICQFKATDMTFETFVGWLAGPGQTFNPATPTEKAVSPPFCPCVHYLDAAVDAFGNKFEDQIDISDWLEYCEEVRWS